MGVEVFGWLGSVFFAICAIPQAIKAYREKHATGVSKWYLIYWFLGEVFMLVYVWDMGDLPLMANYIMNMFFLLIIAKYKFLPTNKI